LPPPPVAQAPTHRREQWFRLPEGLALPADLVRAAVERGDARAVDAALAPIASAYPFAREATDVWPALAAWMASRGEGALAQSWAARGRAVDGVWINDDRRAWASIGRLAPLALGAYLALAIFGFVTGLGVGAGLGARDRAAPLGGGDGPSGVGGGPRPPGPWVLPAVSLGALLFWAALLTGAIAGQRQVILKHESLPAGLVEDRITDPEVTAWIAARVRPPASTALMKRIDAERDAETLEAGRHAPPPSDGELRAALGPETSLLGRIWSGAGALRLTALAPPDSAARVFAPCDSLARGLLGCLLLGAVGVALGRRFRAAWRTAHLVVPGASRWLVAIGPLALALTCAAFAALVASPLVVAAPPPDLRARFGLEAIALVSEAAARPPWIAAVLIAALMAHILGVWLDRRSSRD
jgi:hypothetical protein